MTDAGSSAAEPAAASPAPVAATPVTAAPAVTRHSEEQKTANASLPAEFVGKLAAIRPARVIVFQVQSEVQQFSKTITIRNISGKAISFKIKTTSRDGYRVKPVIGLVTPQQTVPVVVTLLPHNQYHVKLDKFMVMIAGVDILIDIKQRHELMKLWKEVAAGKLSSDYSEHQDVDEVAVNLPGAEAETDVTRQSKREGRFDPPPLKPLPLRTTMRQVFTKKSAENDTTDYKDTPSIMKKIMATVNMLMRHIKCFRCFQLFVVFLLCLAMATIIILALKFPSSLDLGDHDEETIGLAAAAAAKTTVVVSSVFSPQTVRVTSTGLPVSTISASNNQRVNASLTL